MAPTQLSIVLERLLNELGIANLSMFEAVLMHDTGAVQPQRLVRRAAA